jgi:glycosyltransferase involved in cell wall biosynthesis
LTTQQRIMHIGQFTDSYPPIINGVSACVAEHHAQLLARGEKAHVFTAGNRAHNDAQQNVLRASGVRIPTSPFFIPTLTGAWQSLAGALDVFHAHEAFMAGDIARTLAQQHHKPLIFTNHTRHDLYINNYPRMVQPFMRRHTFRIIARAVRQSAIATAPSNETAELLRRLAPDAAARVRVVRNGIRLDQFDHISDCGARDELGIPCDATVYVYVGRLTPEKNLPAFAHALVQAVQAGADAHWVIIGDGMSRELLEEVLAPIQPRAHFLGAVPREDVARYLAMADVFATPSLSEVNPVSVIEALASGRPFIGLQAGWWDEFSNGDGTMHAGVLACDEAALTREVIALCGDLARRRALSDAARKLSHRFDIRDITSQWLAMYEAAIIGRKGD